MTTDGMSRYALCPLESDEPAPLLLASASLIFSTHMVAMEGLSATKECDLVA